MKQQNIGSDKNETANKPEKQQGNSYAGNKWEENESDRDWKGFQFVKVNEINEQIWEVNFNFVVGEMCEFEHKYKKERILKQLRIWKRVWKEGSN